MVTDNQISALLQTAKPLYFAQKRRKKALTSSFCLIAMILGLNFSLSQTPTYIYNLDGLEEEIELTLNGSYIETYDLPTDEYGFLEVV